MAERGEELRTSKYNLLMCIINRDENGGVFLEFKNGKRKDYVPLEQFVEKINKFIEGYNTELHIVNE